MMTMIRGLGSEAAADTAANHRLGAEARPVPRGAVSLAPRRPSVALLVARGTAGQAPRRIQAILGEPVRQRHHRTREQHQRTL